MKQTSGLKRMRSSLPSSCAAYSTWTFSHESSPLCAYGFPWCTSHGPGISNILEAPLQFRLHLHSVTGTSQDLLARTLTLTCMTFLIVLVRASGFSTAVLIYLTVTGYLSVFICLVCHFKHFHTPFLQSFYMFLNFLTIALRAGGSSHAMAWML